MNKIINFLTVWLSKSGDDTFWSWVITFTYAITAILSLYYVKKISNNRPKRSFWIFIFIFILIMGINKQLDVQILIIMVGRFCTTHLGLLEYRHILYFIVFAGIFIFMVAGLTVLFIKTKSIIRHSLIPLTGVLILMFFILVRAGYIYIVHVHSIELLGLLFILSDLIINIHRQKIDCKKKIF